MSDNDGINVPEITTASREPDPLLFYTARVTPKEEG